MPQGEKRAQTRLLLAFLKTTPTPQAARILGVSASRVRQIRNGLGAPISPGLLACFAAHQAQHPSAGRNEGVRRVSSAGWVSVRCRRFDARVAGLAPGTWCLTRRQADGTLLVQPLAAQSALVLQPLPEEPAP